MKEHLIISVIPSINLGGFLDKNFVNKYSNFDGTISFVVDKQTGQIINWPGRPERYLDELG